MTNPEKLKQIHSYVDLALTERACIKVADTLSYAHLCGYFSAVIELIHEVLVPTGRDTEGMTPWEAAKALLLDDQPTLPFED